MVAKLPANLCRLDLVTSADYVIKLVKCAVLSPWKVNGR
jgi:hypothetical protein